MDMFLRILKWSAATGAATLLLTALKPALDRRYNVKCRYYVWLILAAVLLVSPIRWSAFLPAAEVAPLVTIEVPRLEPAIGSDTGLTLQPAAETWDTVPSATAAAPSRSQQTHSRQVQPDPAIPDNPFPVCTLSPSILLPALWVTGAAVFALYHLLGNVWFTRYVTGCGEPAEHRVLALFQEVCQDLGLKHVPRLRVSTAVNSPMVLGIFFPCLLLPENAYGDRELRFILRHELTHYRRHDLWYKLVILAANALHWFNPLVYLLRREADTTLEILCDEAVVSGADRETRQAYCETLLAAIHKQRGLTRAALSTHFYGGAFIMKERFQNLLSGHAKKYGWTVLALTLLLTALCACVAISPASGDEPLSIEEIALWQERLSSDAWNGFVARMYTDVRRLTPDVDASPTPVTVNGGAQSENTVALEVTTGSGLTGTLTIRAGKAVSFTNDLYTAVEDLAWIYLGEVAAAAERSGVGITDQYIANLYHYDNDTFTIGNQTYWVWFLDYRLRPSAPVEGILSVTDDSTLLAVELEDAGGWLRECDWGAAALLINQDGGGNISLEQAFHGYGYGLYNNYTRIGNSNLYHSTPQEWIDLFGRTTGFTHEYLLPWYICNYENNSALYPQERLSAVLPELSAEDAQELLRALAAFLKVYDGGMAYYSLPSLQYTLETMAPEYAAYARDILPFMFTYNPLASPQADPLRGRTEIFTCPYDGFTVEVTNVREVRVTEDSLDEQGCSTFVCYPGAVITILDAGSERVEQDWEEPHAYPRYSFQWDSPGLLGGTPVIDEAEPLAVTSYLACIEDTVTSRPVLEFEQYRD